MAPFNPLPSTTGPGSSIQTRGPLLDSRGTFSVPKLGGGTGGSYGGGDSGCNDEPTGGIPPIGTLTSDGGVFGGSVDSHDWPLGGHYPGDPKHPNITISESQVVEVVPGSKVFVPSQDDPDAGLCGVFGAVNSALLNQTCTIDGTDASKIFDQTVQAYADTRDATGSYFYSEAAKKFAEGMNALSRAEDNGTRVFDVPWQGHRTLANEMGKVARFYENPRQPTQLTFDNDNSCSVDFPATKLRPVLDDATRSEVGTDAQLICDAMMAKLPLETGCDARDGKYSTDYAKDWMQTYSYAPQAQKQGILNGVEAYTKNLEDSEGKSILDRTISVLSDPDASEPDRSQALHTLNRASTCKSASSDVKSSAGSRYKRSTALAAFGMASLAATNLLF